MLVRGLLQLPQQPAVVVVQTVGLSAELLAVGGDIHLPVSPCVSLTTVAHPSVLNSGLIFVSHRIAPDRQVASFYDIPVISLRPLVLPLMMEGANGLDYFVPDGWGHADYRHVRHTLPVSLTRSLANTHLERGEKC
jgi:hypothetical protein